MPTPLTLSLFPILLLLLLSFLAPLVTTQALDQTTLLSTIPRTVPLLNKSPYFGVWASAPEGRDNQPTPAGANLTTWGWRKLDWNGFIRVDGELWQWLGNETTPLGNGTETVVNPVTTTQTYLTATRTVYTMEAGNVVFNLTFLSPIEPQDIVRLSFPFAYVYMDVWSKDGSEHSIQIYSDVASSMVSTRNDTMEWETTQTPTSVYHELQKSSSLPTDRFDTVENGILYFAMPTAANPTWQTGPFSEVRQVFFNDGRLDNIKDEEFRAAMVADYPVLAFAVDLGTIQATSSPVLWALGHVRNDLMTAFGGSIGTETRTSYFWSQYPTIGEAIDAFLSDFPSARTRADEFDAKLMSEAKTISPQYADLVALSVRQTMASIEVTLPRPSSLRDRVWNTTDVSAYMRDTGVSKRSNPVETIYAAMPALLYLNPSLLQLLLKPLLAYQASSRYTNSYAAPDLGDDYIFATGNKSDTEHLGVESCGNMLIMSLAYAQHTKDYASLNRYSSVFTKWADFLITHALHPKDQMSADGLTDTDLSNLALKGITGIYAMAKIQEIVDPAGAGSEDAKRYLNRSTEYASEWETLAVSRGHVTSVYGQPATWTMVYNYFPASLVAPGLFGPKIWEDQANFYQSQLDLAPSSSWGIPYDSSDPGLAKSHWTMFTAATVTNTTTRNNLIEMVHRRTFWRGTAAAFATTWNVDTGATVPLAGRNSPAQGAMFAILAAQIFNSDSGQNPGGSKGQGGGANVGAIVGGVVGGLAGLLLLLGVLFFLWKRKIGPFKYSRPKSRYIPNMSPKTSFSESIRPQPSVPMAEYHVNYELPSEQPIPTHLLPTPFNVTTSPAMDSNPSPTSGQPTQESKELMMARMSNNSRSTAGLSYASQVQPVASSSVSGSVSPPSSRSAAGSSEPQRHLQLQQELEELRREVNVLRARADSQGPQPRSVPYRPDTPSEPPPTYTS